MKISILLASLVLALTGSLVYADKAKLEPVPFIYELNAAKYALRLAYDCSKNKRECGGVIYKKDNLYYVTTPITSNLPFGIDLSSYWDNKNAPTSRHVVTADYHIHICVKENADFANFFSPSDAEVNDGLHINGYILSICDMRIREFNPKQDPKGDIEVDFKSGKKIYLTSGHIVDWVEDRKQPINLPKGHGLDNDPFLLQ
jgi:hypothetical protein